MFKFDPKKWNNPFEEMLTPKDRVLIHLSFDDFEGDQMIFDKDTGTYSLSRMAPAIEIKYFFTVNGVQKYLRNLQTSRVPIENTEIELLYVNIKYNLKKNIKELTPEYVQEHDWYPRPARPGWPDDLSDNTEPRWEFKNSVFHGYIPDNDYIIDQWFDYDWAQCKIPRIIKDEEELKRVRDYLKSIYKHIREAYKYYAGISPCVSVPCIGQNEFNEIINLTTIIDNNKIKISDVDTEFIATKYGKKGVYLNPERWLIRCQLMEVFVRIALQKYIKRHKDVKGAVKLTESEAVVKLFEEELKHHFQKHNCHNWRKEYLWCQEVDESFKNSIDEVKALFHKYSERCSKPGKERFCSLSEFFLMISSSGILETKSIGANDIPSIFNVSCYKIVL